MFWNILLCLGAFVSAQANDISEADLGKFGVVLNADGDTAFMSPQPPQAEALLRADIEAVAHLGIGTIVFGAASGSDALNYSSSVGSPIGWRKTFAETSDKLWSYQMENNRNAIAAGLDAIRIVGEQAKRNGLRFLPSLRMNDSHFTVDPFNHPLTGEFWMKNYSKLRIKESPAAFNPDYANLFDFSHEEVRNYRFAVIEEMMERNKDIIDGIELDFNRVQVFFPKGKAPEGAPLMTDLVRKVRQRLDQVSVEVGRSLSLFVRIPPSLAACNLAGLEVEKWMEEGLVDLVSPAQLMTLAHDMPIRDLIEKAHRSNVLVYPSLYPRTSWRAPLDFSKPDLGLTAPPSRNAVKEEILAAATNYRAMGVDGFYLFNFYGENRGSRPFSDWMHRLVAALRWGRPDASTKVFVVTKTYYYDDVEPSYAYVKQLPFQVTGSKTFTIEIGQVPGDTPFPLRGCILRVGTKDGHEGESPSAAFNGIGLSEWKSFSFFPKKRSQRADAATKNTVYLINNPKLLKRGLNTITISGGEFLVTDLEIAFAYQNEISRLLFRSSSVFSESANFPESGKNTKNSGDNSTR